MILETFYMKFYLKTPVTQEEFEVSAHVVAQMEEVPIVRAIQLTTSELAARRLKADGNNLACGKGCSACCRQMVSVTMTEWDTIEDFLRKKGAQWLKKFRKQAAVLLGTWWTYINSGRAASDQIGLAEDWLDKPCIFLDRDGACQIYEARPIVCRIVTSTERCVSVHSDCGTRWRYPWDMWADQMTMEESAKAEKTTTDDIHIAPLLHLVYRFFNS